MDGKVHFLDATIDVPWFLIHSVICPFTGDLKPPNLQSISLMVFIGSEYLGLYREGRRAYDSSWTNSPLPDKAEFTLPKCCKALRTTPIMWEGNCFSDRSACWCSSKTSDIPCWPYSLEWLLTKVHCAHLGNFLRLPCFILHLTQNESTPSFIQTAPYPEWVYGCLW